MSYTKQQRKQLAQAFSLAKPVLTLRFEGGRNLFICWALADLANASEITHTTCARASELLHRRLGTSATYEHWIRENPPKRSSLRSDPWSDHGRKMCFEARQAWLDSLIQEFSN